MEKNISTANTGFAHSTSEYNTIKVSVSYTKGKGVVAYIQEGKLKIEGVISSFSYDMFGSKKARVLVAEMTRLNKKKLNELSIDFLNKPDSYFISLLA